MVDKKIEALASQLYFAAIMNGHGLPPAGWSPLKVMAVWGEEREAIRKKWIEYAEKVAIFAGLIMEPAST